MLRVLCLISIIMFLPLVEIKKVRISKRQSDDKGSRRVYNGQPASSLHFYYYVSLKQAHPVEGQFLFGNVCGGSLIATSIILTAAHCFEKDASDCQVLFKKPQFLSAKKYHAVAGSLINFQQYDNGGQWRRLRSISPHGDYWAPQKDIAIAHTEKPFIFKILVRSIPIASTFKDYGHVKCKIAGFGRTKYAVANSAAIRLMWADLQLMSDSECSSRLAEDARDYVCTAKADTDVLEGDSGGALVCENTGDPNDEGEGVIVGIACAHYKKQPIFTRVSSYSDFVARGESEALHPVFYIVWLSLVVSKVLKSDNNLTG